MKKIPPPPILPRGRAVHWSREQIDKLSTADLRGLLENAERLQETELAELCRAVLSKRPFGNNAAARALRAAAK